jgi:hypothetical protein
MTSKKCCTPLYFFIRNNSKIQLQTKPHYAVRKPPLVFKDRKINKAKRSYKIGEQDLLSTVPTALEYCIWSIRRKLTDHMITLCGNLSNYCITQFEPCTGHILWRQCLLMLHISWKENVQCNIPSKKKRGKQCIWIEKIIVSHDKPTLEIDLSDKVWLSLLRQSSHNSK